MLVCFKMSDVGQLWCFLLLESLEKVRKQLKAFNDLHVIEYGDHSFQIAEKNLETHEEAEEGAVKAIATFVSRIRNEKVTKAPRVSL